MGLLGLLHTWASIKLGFVVKTDRLPTPQILLALGKGKFIFIGSISTYH